MTTRKSKETLKIVACAGTVLATALLFTGIIFLGKAARDQLAAPSMTKDTLAIVTQTGKKAFDIEVAISPEELSHGLMYRESIADNYGMLFIFPRIEEASMWMRNTKIPLDMLFISPDGTIVHIADNARPYDERVISSRVPVRAALEIKGGQAQALGIKVGNKVESRYFNGLLKTP